MTDLHVGVADVPDVALIRPAIEAALAGRAWPDGPEAAIARAVVDTVDAQGAVAEEPAGGAGRC